MNAGDIFWTHVKMTGFGDRIVPYYFTRQGPPGAVYGRTARNGDECAFVEKSVFATVEEARANTGIDRVFCFENSSLEHFSIVREIHTAEGLVCPNCGPGTLLFELDPEKFKSSINDGYTHYCSAGKDINVFQYQVTLGKKAGCENYITLKLKSSRQCNCGAPIVDHVPGGSYCWITLDKERKYL